MNILPKKSWHVLSRDNIQRVRRDEADAKAKEEELQRRAEIAEKEARLNLMRKRAHERDGYSDEDEPVPKEVKVAPSPSTITDQGHINFFADVKQGVGMQTTNVDHDKEKKEEQEKYEKRIGLLNYLVDKDKSDDPWYSKSKGAAESAKSKRLKDLMDPLNDMKCFVTQTRKLSTDQSTVVGGRGAVPMIAAASGSTSHSLTSKSSASDKSVVDKDDRKSKSHKHHKEHKSKSKHKRKKEVEREKEERLEELRRQRRKREEAERAKAEALLRGHHGQNGSSVGSTAQAVEDTTRRYNSQFNPHLVRRHK